MTTILAGLPPVQLYQIITKDEPSYVSKYVAASPQATNDLAYFQANAAKFTTVDSLMKDTRALSVVLTAFGLQSDLNSAGLIKKVMTENPNTTTSVAYQTGNVALAKLGTAMGQWTTPPFASAANVQAIVAAYSQNSFESSEDSVSPGIQAALHFTNTIASVTSINQLMSDPQLVSVAAGGANLPSNFGTLDYGTQVNLMTQAIDLTKFSDPAYVQKFVTNYLVTNSTNTSSSTSADAALTLLGGGTTTAAAAPLSVLYPNAGVVGGDLLSTLYGLNSSTSSSSTDPTLSLFA